MAAYTTYKMHTLWKAWLQGQEVAIMKREHTLSTERGVSIVLHPISKATFPLCCVQQSTDVTLVLSTGSQCLIAMDIYEVKVLHIHQLPVVLR